MTNIARIKDRAAFRAAIREWIATTQPYDGSFEPGREDENREIAIQRWWMKKRAEVGLAIPHWPKEFGGEDLDMGLQAVMMEEFARGRCPSQHLYIVSLNHIPATLMEWGTPEQRARYMPGVAAGEVWCQGFSEPGAGSDLAALRTRAENRGDHYLINGQKIWSSYSMYARRCILLARTDPDSQRHAGISFFVMDMDTPGVEVRPIRQANGQAKFGEIFLTDVVIPKENLVGEEGGGWAIAQTTLAAERGLPSLEQAERLRYFVEDVLDDAVRADAPWLRDDELRREFVALFGRLQSLRLSLRKMIEAHGSGEGVSATAPSSIKIRSSEFRHDIGALRMRFEGLSGQLDRGGYDDLGDHAMYVYLTSFGGIVGGGTNEIMRNIIAERGLGMPRK